MRLFGSQRMPEIRFGCFGKLPTYGDFVSLNAEGAEAQAFTGWLADGTSAMPPDAVVAADQTIAFAWRPPGTRRALVGAMWPSSDAAGRRFPFAIFASYPEAQLEPHGPRKLIAAAAVWQGIREIRAQAARLKSIREQYAKFDVPAPALLDADAVWHAFVDRAHGALLRRDDAAPFGLHLQELQRYADALRGAAELPEFALRMRLVHATDPEAEAAGWMHILTRRLDVEDLDGALFVRHASAPGPSLFVFHRPLSAADLGFILAPADGYRRADSIGFRGAAAVAPDARALDAFQRRWSSGSPSVATVLEISGDPLPPPEVAPLVPALPPDGGASAEPATADGDITGEMGPEVTTASADVRARPPQTDAPTTAGILVEAPDGAPITAQPAAPMSGTDAIDARIRQLAAGPLLSGRLVRASTAASSASVTGDVASGASTLIYLDDKGRPAMLDGVPAAAIRVIESQIADYAEALELVEQIRRVHRATEDRLLRSIDEACARTPRPGGRAPA